MKTLEINRHIFKTAFLQKNVSNFAEIRSVWKGEGQIQTKYV